VQDGKRPLTYRCRSRSSLLEKYLFSPRAVLSVQVRVSSTIYYAPLSTFSYATFRLLRTFLRTQRGTTVTNFLIAFSQDPIYTKNRRTRKTVGNSNPFFNHISEIRRTNSYCLADRKRRIVRFPHRFERVRNTDRSWCDDDKDKIRDRRL